MTNASLTATQAISSIPFALRLAALSTYPGRWRWEQAGVKAPGTANRTTFLPRKISSVVNSFTPSGVSCFSVTDGILSPTLIVMVSLRWYAGPTARDAAYVPAVQGPAGRPIAQSGSLGKSETDAHPVCFRRERVQQNPCIGVSCAEFRLKVREAIVGRRAL